VRKSFEDYYPKVVSEGQPSCLSEIGQQMLMSESKH